mmetsp:Transcript_9205/g.30675  ORF Transcript_9205/g.30675 Transcript_9205/m.30675 type:complete len:357 (-) Transcript_9205:4143-5213(-)
MMTHPPARALSKSEVEEAAGAEECMEERTNLALCMFSLTQSASSVLSYSSSAHPVLSPSALELLACTLNSFRGIEKVDRTVFSCVPGGMPTTSRSVRSKSSLTIVTYSLPASSHPLIRTLMVWFLSCCFWVASRAASCACSPRKVTTALLPRLQRKLRCGSMSSRVMGLCISNVIPSSSLSVMYCSLGSLALFSPSFASSPFTSTELHSTRAYAEVLSPSSSSEKSRQRCRSRRGFSSFSSNMSACSRCLARSACGRCSREKNSRRSPGTSRANLSLSMLFLSRRKHVSSDSSSPSTSSFSSPAAPSWGRAGGRGEAARSCSSRQEGSSSLPVGLRPSSFSSSLRRERSEKLSRLS